MTNWWTSLCPADSPPLAQDPLSPCAREVVWLTMLPLAVGICTAVPFMLNARLQAARCDSDGDDAKLRQQERTLRESLSDVLGASSYSVRLFVLAAVAHAVTNAYAAFLVATADQSEVTVARLIAHVVQSVLALMAAVIVGQYDARTSTCRPLSFAWACIPFSAVVCLATWIDWRLASVEDHLRIAAVVCSSLMLVAAVFRYESLTNALFTAASNSPDRSRSRSSNLLLVNTSTEFAAATAEPPVSFELMASFWQRMTQSWLTPLMELGHRQPLELSDCWTLPADLTTAAAAHSFHKAQPKRRVVAGTPIISAGPLAWQLIKFNLGSYAYQITMVVLGALSGFASPYFLQRILQYLQSDPNSDSQEGFYRLFLYTIAMFVITVFGAVCLRQYIEASRKTSIRMRCALMATIYSKTLTRKTAASPAAKAGDSDEADKKDDDDAGQTKSKLDVNVIISTDIMRIVFFTLTLEPALASPITIIGCVYGLYQVIGVAAFAGVSLLLIAIPINGYLGHILERAEERVMNAKDARIGKTGEFLQGIRAIKFFAWENKVQQRITDLRNVEVKKRVQYQCYASVLGIFMNIVPALVIFVSFVTYAKVMGQSLDYAKVFTALALFNMLRMPLWGLGRLLPQFYETRVSVRRIVEYLAQQDVRRYQVDKQAYLSGAVPALPGVEARDVTDIAFVNASFDWERETTETPVATAPDDETVPLLQNDQVSTPVPRFQLRDLTIRFPEGKLTLVVGPTGHGKSSLLHALLGEMKPLAGHVFLPKTDRTMLSQDGLYRGVAYVPQQAWLLNATIRNNILFGDDYEQSRYQRMLRDCALVRDMQILEGGDNTEIGEKGINLSGGQKQRISLARACYNRAQNILMDDVLSAVDAPTAAHIFKHCIAGPNAQLAGRTRVLVTHNVGLTAPRADWIVFMKDGRAVAQGPTARDVRDQVAALGLEEVSLFDGVASVDTDDEAVGEEESDHLIDNGSHDVKLADKKGTQLVKDEDKAAGSVSWRIYYAYIMAIGGWLWAIVFVLTTLVPELLNIFDTWWLKHWTDAYAVEATTPDASALAQLMATSQDVTALAQPVDINYYLGVLALIGLAIAVVDLLTSFVRIYISMRGGVNLHKRMLARVLAAPVAFFDKTPIGRLTNRFSSDIGSVDEGLTDMLGFFLWSTLSSAVSISVVLFIAPWFTLMLIPIVVSFYFVAVFYLSSSRELKRIEATTRSPIYSIFGETAAGASVIRAFEASAQFSQALGAKVDTFHRPHHLLWATNRWLGIRTNFLANFAVLACGLVICFGRRSIGAGLAGLALNYCISFTGTCVWVIRAHAMVEMEMNAVERVVEYLEIEQEAPAVIPGQRPPASWPAEGAISVRNLVVKYTPALPPVLKDVSFDVRGGEKIGVVGRTGAGKSTLAIAFFRIMEASQGTITVDGVDIARIGLEDLRSRLTIIPQDPVLFEGTIRSNLDVFDEHDDQMLWTALRRVHLNQEETDQASSSDDTDAPPNISLDSPVSEGGANLSVGQRQLLTLARALLRRSKVIVMDESTANVSHDLDAKIQETIRSEFTSSTILCIAHRLRTVIDFDRILVLDHGEVREFDSPRNLLKNKEGIFYTMCAESGEFNHLLDVANRT
ncbi:Transporter of the ATP-binding cassette (ABC) [Sorochytrium milnesiophthora]